MYQAILYWLFGICAVVGVGWLVRREVENAEGEYIRRVVTSMANREDADRTILELQQLALRTDVSAQDRRDIRAFRKELEILKETNALSSNDVTGVFPADTFAGIRAHVFAKTCEIDVPISGSGAVLAVLTAAGAELHESWQKYVDKRARREMNQ
jgi:hypothetical protein